MIFLSFIISEKVKGAILKDTYLPDKRVASSPDNSFELDPVINSETFKVALNELIIFF